jgi:UDP-galactopyranose mutase
LNTDFFDIKSEIPRDSLLVYTGPIDRFFEYKFGILGWRTLDFEIERVEVDDYQGTSVVNYPDLNVPFTRIHEFKHLHPERSYPKGKTIIMKEFSRQALPQDEPYYPINSIDDRRLILKYRSLIDSQPRVVFGGRLGTYQYLDMHMAIASAFSVFSSQVKPRFL